MKKYVSLLLVIGVLSGCASSPIYEEVKKETKVNENLYVVEGSVKNQAKKDVTKRIQLTKDEFRLSLIGLMNGSEESIRDVTIDNGAISAVVELDAGVADGSKLTDSVKREKALEIYSDSSRDLLNKGIWDTLTIEFIGVGTINLRWSDSVADRHGRYFEKVTIDKNLKK